MALHATVPAHTARPCAIRTSARVPRNERRDDQSPAPSPEEHSQNKEDLEIGEGGIGDVVAPPLQITSATVKRVAQGRMSGNSHRLSGSMQDGVSCLIADKFLPWMRIPDAHDEHYVQPVDPPQVAMRHSQVGTLAFVAV